MRRIGECYWCGGALWGELVRLTVDDERCRLHPDCAEEAAREDDVARRERLRDLARDAEGERAEMDAERRRML